MSGHLLASVEVAGADATLFGRARLESSQKERMHPIAVSDEPEASLVKLLESGGSSIP